MGFVFCDSYYPIDRGGGGASTGGGGQHGRGGDGRGGPARAGGARAGKDRARGSSTGALCTKFTLVCLN
jgi:hypothetical protein